MAPAADTNLTSITLPSSTQSRRSNMIVGSMRIDILMLIWQLTLVLSTLSSSTSISAAALVSASSQSSSSSSSLMGGNSDSSSPRILSIEDFGAIPDDDTNNDHDGHLADLHCLKEFERERGSCVDDPLSSKWLTHEDNNKNNNNMLDRARNNTDAFNRAIEDAQPGDTVLIPDQKSYIMMGGVIAENRTGLTVDIAGSLYYVHDPVHWPIHWSQSTLIRQYTYRPALAFLNCTDLILTCSSTTRAITEVDYKTFQVHLVDADTHRGGIVNGHGKGWWDDEIAGRIHERLLSRPRLIHIIESEDVLVEHLTLINSPYWTLTVEAVRGEVRYTNVLVDRSLQADLFAKYDTFTNDDGNALEWLGLPGNSSSVATTQQRMMLRQGGNDNSTSSTTTNTKPSFDFPFPIDDLPDWIGRKLRQPQDLNTDGIDAYGKDISIHDCIIQNSDDSISIKPSSRRFPENVTRIPNCTSNITMSNLVLTGFGASVGSCGPVEQHNCINGVKFINISMPGTGKGIYIKSNPSNCSHGQTSRLSNVLYENIDIIQPFWWAIWIGPQQQHEPNDSIGMKCPLTWPLPGAERCPTQACATFENITLRNVMIFHPVISPGVILGNASNPIQNVVIENLHVDESKYKPWQGKWPFHDRRYPWHGRIKCENAFGTAKDSYPAPGCLAVTP